MKEPFVSIIICTHNRKNALKKYALKSSTKIDYQNYEIVIIDDASTDGTEDIVNEFKYKFDKIKYFKNKKHKSLCFVRNLGVKNSKGSIIVFIDDDCYVYKDWLKEIVKPYQDEEVMMVGGVSFIKDSKKVFVNDSDMWGCNMSFRKKAFDKFRFDTFMTYAPKDDEFDIIKRMELHGLKKVINKKAKLKHYIEPAIYRKNYDDRLLSIIYLSAKNIDLFEYYNILYKYLKGIKFSNEIISHNYILKTLKTEKDNILRSIKIKIYVILITLLNEHNLKNNNINNIFEIFIKIPIKAKIKHIIEETRYLINTYLTI